MFIFTYIISCIFDLALVFVFDKVRLRMFALLKLCNKTLDSRILHGIADLLRIGVMEHCSYIINKIYICTGQIKSGYIRYICSHIADIGCTANITQRLSVNHDRIIH